jgi:hypothetical protein
MTYSSYPVSGGGGSGDVQGPVLSVNNGVVLFDGTSGKTIKDLGVGSANQVLVTDGTTPSFALIADANVSGSAAIAYSKLAALTASRALQSSAGGVIEVSSVTSTELGYVSGVTSSIQTQLNAKEPTISLTANRAVVSSAGGTLAVSATTDTEIGYVSGVTSAIQTQIDSKTGIADNETITGNWTFNNIITGSITGNAGTVTNGVYTTGDQSIAGIKTFSSTIVGSISGNAGTVTNGAYINVTNSFTSTQNILATTNQLVLGTTNTTTISATAPASSAVYTIPDVGTTADFVLTAGTQTIAGAKTFSDDLTVGSNALFVDVSAGNVGIGTSSPATLAHFKGASPTVLIDTSTGSQDARIAFAEGSGLANVTFDLLYEGSAGISPNNLFKIRASSTANGTMDVTALTLTQAGAVTLGPSSGTAVSNTVQGNSTSGTLRVKAGSFSGHIALERDTTSVGTVWLGTANGDFRIGSTAGGTNIGQATAAGAWTLGPSGGTYALTHTINTTSGTGSGDIDIAAGVLSSGISSTIRFTENGTTKAQIGIYESPSANTTGYIRLNSSDGVIHFVWFDDNDILRWSTSATNIGTTTGTAI